MVTDPDGLFVSQREYPGMARIVPTLTDTELQISVLHMPTLCIPLDAGAALTRRSVTIWDDTLHALDEGDAAAQWFSQALDADVRLVRFDDVAFTQFVDGFPILVTAWGSLDELNGRPIAKGAPAIPMNRFRSNVVLSGLEAYDEDFLDTLSIGAGGGVVLRLVKPCARCPIPTITQDKGTRDARWSNEPLDTMAAYRANRLVDGGLTFGQNAIVIHGDGAWLHAGQPVQYEWNFT